MSVTDGSRFWYSGIFVALLVLLVATSFISRLRLETVKQTTLDSSPLAFSSERAAKVLSGLLGDESPHPVDSAANRDVRHNIIEKLASLGYHAEVQDATSCRSAEHTCARVRNIVAVRDGVTSGKAILLTAHYDSVPAGPGASDDGVGVAILLEIARLIEQRPPNKNVVVFLFTEGEEAGLLGAEAFASRHPLAGKVASVINIEARGTSGQSTMFETGSNSGWLVDRFASTSRRPLANSLVAAVYTLLPNDTDLSVFKARGLQGLNFAYGEHFSFYHTPLDNLHALDLGSLQQQGDNVYDVLNTLVNADIPDDNAMGNVVYTDVLGFGVLHWPTQWGLIAAIALIALFAFATWRLRKYQTYSRRSVVYGLLGFVASLVLGAGVAYALTYVLSMLHGPANAWHTADTFNRLFLWTSVLLAVISVQRLVARKSDPTGLWVGLGWAWLLMALATAFALPGASYLFLLPSTLFVVCAFGTLISAHRITDHRLKVLQALPALAAFPIVIPSIFLIEIMLGFNGGTGVVAMGALIGIVTSPVLPFAKSRQAPRVYTYTTYIALAVLVISGVLSFRAPIYTAARPQPLNVMYVQDSHDKAMVATGTAFNHPPEAVLKAMGKDAALHNVFPWTDSRFYSVPVPTAELPSATLAVLNKTKTSDGWQITARIDAGEHASMIELLFPKAAGLQSIETDGQRLDYSKSSGNVAPFICRGDSCNGRQITLTLKETGHEVMIVVESRQLPESAAAIARARGDQATSRNDGDQSLVLGAVQL